jgi:hypothetical protein
MENTSNTDKSSNEIYKLLPTVAGKSPDRVAKHWLKYPDEWKAQYNMLLMDGDTCGNCAHSRRCELIFGGDNNNTKCQFYPSRFARSEPL